MTSINASLERLRLSQSEILTSMSHGIRPTEMVTVYQREVAEQHDRYIYCALIPNDRVQDSLDDPQFDLYPGGGMPGAVVRRLGGNKEVEYLRFGNGDGIEPLVILRQFHGIRDDYAEISEEFRLFHRLYYDKAGNKYIKIDDSGNETLVAIVSTDHIQIRMLEIRQFLSIKEMHLAINFESVEKSDLPIATFGSEGVQQDQREELTRYELSFGDFGGVGESASFSCLRGKRLIPPLPKERSGFWGFAEDRPKRYCDFIIGSRADGGEIEHICDPNQLSNLFGANPGRPSVIKGVHFRKEVLDKYYHQPSKFSVEDGYLRCGGLWGMRVDNHHSDRVVALLGDLGRDLPYEEQLHWRSYNIAPSGGMSPVSFRRQILAEFVDSDRPDHVFTTQYDQLEQTCSTHLGWQILIPLHPGDQYHLQCLRIPATGEHKDFDELVMGLTKVLIDSLNEGELMKLIPDGARTPGMKGIQKLKAALDAAGVPDYEPHIEFLRALQQLRSAGSAHRKGSNYEKVGRDFGVGTSSLPTVFEGILTKAVEVLKFFDHVIEAGYWSARPNPSEVTP